MRRKSLRRWNIRSMASRHALRWPPARRWRHSLCRHEARRWAEAERSASPAQSCNRRSARRSSRKAIGRSAGVVQGVDLGAASGAGSPDGLVFLPPIPAAAERCARTAELCDQHLGGRVARLLKKCCPDALRRPTDKAGYRASYVVRRHRERLSAGARPQNMNDPA